MSGTPASAGDVFAELLGPVTFDDFFARSFERAPLLVARNDATHFGALFSIADLEDTLHAGAAHADRFVLVKAGAALAVDAYSVEVRPLGSPPADRRSARALDPRLVLAQFDRGYTLVINDASAFCARLRALCNRMQSRLGFFFLANVYLSPGGTPGFDVHSDAHGTIVLQIAGRKVWRIYAPLVELPIEAHTAALQPRREDLTLVHEIALAPGDTLYIPQGFPHEALAGERALHVTLAIRPPRIADLAEMLVRLAVAGDVALRRALPAAWHTSPDVLAGVTALIRERLTESLTRERADLAVEMLLGDVSSATPATARGMFDVLTAVTALQPAAVLCVRDDAPYTLRHADETIVLMVGDRTFSLPADCAPMIERLGTGGLRYADVQSALGADDARDFVKFLALVGLLQTT